MKDIADRILYEDNHILAVNKLAGEIAQGDKTGDMPLSELLKSYIKKKYQKPGEVFLGTVHRLDRPVSGLILYARTSKALSRLNELFREKNIQKTYWAIVRKMPPHNEGKLIHFLKKNEIKNMSTAYDKEVNGSLRAELDYKVLLSSDNYHLLEINLHTGRHHQIRCQLSAIGCPIKGDLKYGDKRSNPDGSISLHARKIEFIHPVKKDPVVILAPVPPDALWQYFEKNSD